MTLHDFVPIERVDEFYGLARSDPDGLSRYPGETTWRIYQGAGHLLESLWSSFRDLPAVLMYGLPKCGKTFHSLLFGYHWKDSPSLGLQSGANRRAFYACANAVDLSSVRTQWDIILEQRSAAGRLSGPCLWIVDDVHYNLELCRELLESFREQELPEAENRLLFIGRSAHDLHGLPTVEVSLLSDTILLAALAAGLKSPPTPIREDLASRRTLSIKQILWACAKRPTLLEHPDMLQRAFIDQWLHGLTAEQQTLVLDIARLRFLGLSYPGEQLREAHDLRHLTDIGLAQQTKGGLAGWTVADDIARSILRHGGIDTGFVSSFHQPLSACLSRNPRILAPLASALGATTREALCEWLGRSDRAGASQPLLPEFVQRSEPVIVRTLVDPNYPLKEVSRILLVCADQIDVRHWADAVLAKRAEEIAAALSTNDVPTWRHLSILNRHASEPVLGDALIGVLTGAEFTPRFRAAPRQVQDLVLEEMGHVDAARAKALKRDRELQVINDYTGDGNKPSPAVWKAFRALATTDRTTAVASFKSLTETNIRALVFSFPRACRGYLRDLGGLADTGIRPFLQAALGDAAPTASDIARWKRDDLNEFMQLASEIGRRDLATSEMVMRLATDVAANGKVGQVVDLCVTVRITKTVALQPVLLQVLLRRIEIEANPPNSYMYAVLQLDHAKGSALIESALRRVVETSIDLDEDTFWLLWNGVSALEAYSPALGHAADSIAARWVVPDPTPPGQISLAGLLAYVRRSPPPPLTFAENVDAADVWARATSPPLTVCQLRAIAAFPAGSGRGRQEWLQGLAEAISDPLLEFRVSWHRLPPRMCRRLLRMVCDAAWLLRSDTTLRETALRIARSSADRQRDWMWNTDIPTRLSLALSFDVETAKQLLLRQVRWFRQSILNGQLLGNAIVDALFYATVVARNRPDAAGPIRDLIDSAASLHGQAGPVGAAIVGLGRILQGVPLRQPGADGARKRVFCKDPIVRLLAEAVWGVPPDAGAIDWVRKNRSEIEVDLLMSTGAIDQGAGSIK